MSFHTGQTFTFGETPSATKWNYIWENDYALRDGTGIADDAILQRHLADGIVNSDRVDWAAATGKIWYQELARVTASGGANPTSLDTGTIAAKKWIRIIVLQFTGGASLTSFVRLNNDSGANYQYRTSENGAADSNTNGATGISLGANALEGMSGFFDVHNVANKLKVGAGFNTYYTTGNTQIYRNSQAFKWENNSAQMTRYAMISTAGSYKDGSELIILGHD